MDHASLSLVPVLSLPGDASGRYMDTLRLELFANCTVRSRPRPRNRLVPALPRFDYEDQDDLRFQVRNACAETNAATRPSMV